MLVTPLVRILSHGTNLSRKIPNPSNRVQYNIPSCQIPRSFNSIAPTHCMISRRLHSSHSHRNQNVNQVSDHLMELGKFPSRVNTCINFLKSGYKYVIERFGKFNRVENAGLCVLIPFIDRIAYAVDERELCIRIDPELATSADNVQVSLGGNLYVQFDDAEKASYGASMPLYAVSQFAQSAMRTAVGGLKLDTLFSERSRLNVKVREDLVEGTDKWGCKVIRFEITDIKAVDEHVAQSLHKQSTAERERREKIISAEAFKKETELKADAYKYKQITEAEGDAEKTKIAADADAYKILRKSEAEKEGTKLIANALNEDGGIESMQTRLSSQYFETLKSLGSNSTIIIPQDLSNVTSMIATGHSVLKRLTASNNSGNQSNLDAKSKDSTNGKSM